MSSIDKPSCIVKAFATMCTYYPSWLSIAYCFVWEHTGVDTARFGFRIILVKFYVFVERAVAEQKRQKKENERQQREMVCSIYLKELFKSLLMY